MNLSIYRSANWLKWRMCNPRLCTHRGAQRHKWSIITTNPRHAHHFRPNGHGANQFSGSWRPSKRRWRNEITQAHKSQPEHAAKNHYTSQSSHITLYTTSSSTSNRINNVIFQTCSKILDFAHTRGLRGIQTTKQITGCTQTDPYRKGLCRRAHTSGQYSEQLQTVQSLHAHNQLNHKSFFINHYRSSLWTYPSSRLRNSPM